MDLQPKRWVGWAHDDRMENEMIELQAIEYASFSLSVRLKNRKEGSQWWLSCI